MSLRRACLPLAVLLAAAVCCRVSLAQGFSALEPPITTADSSALATLLEFSEDQKSAAALLHESFLAALATRTKPFRELEIRERHAAEVHAEDFPALRKQFDPAVHDFLLARQQLSEGFIADLRALLTKQQADELWPRAERYLHHKELARLGAVGMTGWARFDLGRIIAGLKLSGDELAAAAPIVAAWEVAIDTPLAQRQKLWAERSRLGFDEYKEVEADSFEREYAICRRVAALNRIYTRQAIEALPSEAAEKLTAAVNPLVYPLFAEPHKGRAALSAATGLPGLTSDQRAALESLRVRYERDSGALDREVIRRSDAAEEEVARNMEKPPAERNALAQEDKDLPQLIYKELQRPRDSLEKATADAAMALLTPDQRAKLEPPAK